MRSVRFSYSDIEGKRAILITEQHADGSLSCVKLFPEECEEVADICRQQPRSADADLPADYANIRDCLGHMIGQSIVDITQHDREEWEETHRAYVHIMLSGGDYMKFYIGLSGFDHSGVD